ncbi:cell wall hydrolase [Phenylobacterium sp. LjRoot225]|uniref:cell wall hydrolase n=1 Tax=Phenylobacterium sp. LjRoot225 TaxID=3342285 RepID=UPI003ECF1879
MSHIARVAFRARRIPYGGCAGSPRRAAIVVQRHQFSSIFRGIDRHPSDREPLLTIFSTIPRLGARLGAIGAALALTGSCTPGGHVYVGADRKALTTSGLSNADLARFAGRLDPAARALAERHDPAELALDAWGRPQGWAVLDLARAPDLGIAVVAPETAQQVNALRPFANAAIRPMRPFVFSGAAADQDRALQCLSQAVYYEAARESRKGQEAVAQVVLNRVRHPAYPKSVCGVVYQGAAKSTGCQFTFTCDGALRWRPEPALWSRAQQVARRALAGFVDRDVGSATHYHAAYVAPYWAPTLVKMTQVGQHIFYRWTGPWGEPRAFTGRYAGREAELTSAVLGSDDPRAPDGPAAPDLRQVTLTLGGEVRTYKVADAAAPGGERTRVIGVIQPIRRRATPEEIQRINDNLAGLEQQLDAASADGSAKAASANAPG